MCAPRSDVFKLQVDCYFYASGGNRHPASRPSSKKENFNTTFVESADGQIGKWLRKSGQVNVERTEGVNFERQLAKVFPSDWAC